MSLIALNKIIAIEKGVKAAAERELTNVYHAFQRTAALSGIARTYRPKDEEGDQLPPESTQVQVRVESLLAELSKTLIREFDVVATKDYGNCEAKADVIVDGVTVLNQVPVTYLLFLEKQLVHMNTLIEKLPTLDPAERWLLDSTSNAWATEPVVTTRTKKVPKNWVKAEATDKHPAQVEVYHEDVLVGYWSTIKFSGAVPAMRVAELSARVKRLQEAVKSAREEANSKSVSDITVGKAVFDYLFA